MRQQSEKPIGIVNIVYDTDANIQNCNLLTNFFSQHRYAVQQFNMKNIIISTDLIAPYDFKTIELKVGFGIGWKKR